MKKISTVIAIITSIISISLATEKSNALLGTWVVGDAGLILTFSGKDSLSVASVTDSSVKGNGTYVKSDTTFSATINNNDIIMKMQYRYRWKNKDNVEAQAILFTVNGDSVESPKEWASMTRYSKVSKTEQGSTKKSTPVKTAK
jgi:hypothetical protein